MRLEYFQMVDRIEVFDPEGRTVRAVSTLPDQSPVFEGHFPGYPIMPGVLMIETMAQTGGWLVMGLLGFDRMAFLAQVKEAKMRAFLQPGTPIEVTSTLIHDGSGYAVAEGRITREGREVAAAEITYRVMPFPTVPLRDQMVAAARRVGVPEHLLPGVAGMAGQDAVPEGS